MRGRRACVTAATLCAFAAPTVCAQNYPAKPVKVVVGFAAGGATASMGFEVAGGTPAEFGEFIRAETTKWAKVVKQSGARAD